VTATVNPTRARAGSPRWCRCGTRLARDRTGERCGVCEAAYRERWAVPPQVPADFWTHPPLAGALAARHMGRVLREYRCHPRHGDIAVPQDVVGGWLRLTQAQISRVENGSAGKNLDWLAGVARTLRIPADRLWFHLDGGDGGDAAPVVATVAPRSTVAPRTPNDLIRRARLARRSPSGSGRVLSRQEVADAVNASVFATCGVRTCLDDHYIGSLERGVTRWPRAHVRAALRSVLGAATDAEIGLFVIKNTGRRAEVTAPPVPAQPPQTPDAVAPQTGAAYRSEVASEPPTLHLSLSAGASFTIAFSDTGPGGTPPVRLVVSTAEEPHEIDQPWAEGARVYSMAAWRGRRG